MAFARNHWYVVASAAEIGGQPLARTVCGDDLVLWRSSDGTASELADRCSHRRYPLSLGSVVDDVLVCGYHGFTYHCAGACIAVPGQARIPSRADVRDSPLATVGPWVVVWMGDPEAPDLTRLPDAPWLTDSAWAVVSGMQPLAARYVLEQRVAAEPGGVEVDIKVDRGGLAARRAPAALVTDEAGLASVAAP